MNHATLPQQVHFPLADQAWALYLSTLGLSEILSLILVVVVAIGVGCLASAFWSCLSSVDLYEQERAGGWMGETSNPVDLERSNSDQPDGPEQQR
jgi:hypothetical protein